MLKDDGTMEIFNSNIPEGEISIDYNFTKADTYVTPEFTIKTGNGYSYVFGGTFDAVEYNIFADDAAMITPSAFKLRRIIAPNGSEAIFSYGNHLKESRQIISYYTNLTAENENHYHYSSVHYSKAVISVFSSPITHISINGKQMLEFTYIENGHDEDSMISYDNPRGLINNYYQFHYQRPMDLRTITIKNWTRDDIVHITLEKQFVGNAPSRMFLANVNSSTDGKFCFLYDVERENPPYNNTTATDYWGFWNGT